MHLQRDSNDQRRLPSTPGFLDKLSSHSHCRGCNTSNKPRQRSKGATSVGHASGVDDGGGGGGGGGEFWQKSTVAPSVSQSVPVASESGKRSSTTTYGRRVPLPSVIPSFHSSTACREFLSKSIIPTPTKSSPLKITFSSTSFYVKGKVAWTLYNIRPAAIL